MGVSPLSEVYFAVRRALARTGEISVVGYILELLGIIEFSMIFDHAGHALAGGMISIGASLLFDLYDMATRPQIILPPCDSRQERLPFEEQ